MVRHSIAEARKNLPTLVREAEAGGAVELTRHGEPVAVLVGRGTYERLCAGRQDFWNCYSEWRSRNDVEALDLDPEEIFGNVRDETPGREVDL